MMNRLLGLLALLSVGCGGIQVTADHDPGADFGGYQTYGWAPVNAEEVSEVPDVEVAEFDENVKQILAEQLAAEGLTPSDTPDLLVGWYADVHKKQSVRKVGRRYSYGYGWNEGQTRVYEYAEGTFRLDFADAKSDAMVWTSTATGSAKFNEDPVKREQRLRDVIQRMLAGYPPSGGQ